MIGFLYSIHTYLIIIKNRKKNKTKKIELMSFKKRWRTNIRRCIETIHTEKCIRKQLSHQKTIVTSENNCNIRKQCKTKTLFVFLHKWGLFNKKSILYFFMNGSIGRTIDFLLIIVFVSSVIEIFLPGVFYSSNCYIEMPACCIVIGMRLICNVMRLICNVKLYVCFCFVQGSLRI